MPPGTPNLKDQLKEAVDLIAHNEGKNALDILDAIIAEASKDKTTKPLVAEATVKKALAYLSLGDLQKAQELSEQALVVAKDALVINVEGEALRILSNICWKKGDYSKGLEAVNKALEIGKRTKSAELEGCAHLEKGTILNYTGESDSAEREFRDAVLLLDQAGNLKELSRAYNNFANTYMTMKKFEKAAEMFTRARKISERIGDEFQVALGSMNKAECLAEMGQFDEALKELEPVLPVFEKLDNIYGQMAATHTYGFIYGKMKDWTKAEQFMLKARRIAQKAGFLPAEAKIVIDMGRMFKWRGDKDKAMLYFEEAKTLLEKSGAKRELARLAEEMKEEI